MAASAQSVADYFGDNILYINVMNIFQLTAIAIPTLMIPKWKTSEYLLQPTRSSGSGLSRFSICCKATEGNDNRPLVNRIESLHGRHTVDYAETIGLGSKNYELVVLDT